MNEQTWIDPCCDRRDWPSGPWDGEPDKVQWTDEISGFVCLAKRHCRSGHWCGYVGVDSTHPWHGKNFHDDNLNVEVHFGLTYTDACQEGAPEMTVCHIPQPGKPDHLWWLGFDCAHCDDYSPSDAAMARDRGYPFTLSSNETYKDLDFVKRECRHLALQARDAVQSERVNHEYE